MNERLERLREKMRERGIDVYVVPTSDFHESEYVGEHFACRKYITGFTGSAVWKVCPLSWSILGRSFRKEENWALTAG